MVGIFFKIDDHWLIDAVEVADGEPFGDAIQHGAHYAYWEALVPSCPAEYRFKRHAYDYYPRGRVVYFPKRNAYVVYYDTCLSERDLIEIAQRFVLENSARNPMTDSHYRCSSCNERYSD